MARKQPPEGYYTATAAKRRLGNISDGMLRSYVIRGQIKRTVPAERKQGFYWREDVDRIAKSLEEFFTHENRPSTNAMQFLQATKDDMPECVEMLIEVFGGGDTTARRQGWIDANPETAFIVRNRKRIVACAFALPLTPEKIDVIFADPGSASIASITADDIQPMQPDKESYLYLASIAVRKSQAYLARRLSGLILLRGMTRYLKSLGVRGIPIKLLAARSETFDGIRLLRHLGFTEIESATAQHLFIVEVERSGIPAVMEYKTALRQYLAKSGKGE